MSPFKIGVTSSLLLIAFSCHASKLCGYVSHDTKWDGGVFSVIDLNGITIATTPYIPTGGKSCTDSFIPGQYIIRFNGVLQGKSNPLADGLYGCITEVYNIPDTIFTIVFQQGNPPFNGNSFCAPHIE